VKAIEATFVWTPNRGGWTAYPTAGQVEVTKLPIPHELRGHPMSAGSCELRWRNASDEGRLYLMQRYYIQMIYCDDLDRDLVLATVRQVDEFANHHFSDARPDPDDSCWQ
jgi:hypothetical protein